MNPRYLLSSFLFVCCLFCAPGSMATHIMGGEISYRCLGGGDYELDLVLYRDCAGINLPGSMIISRNASSCSVQVMDTLPLFAASELTPLCGYTTTCQGGIYPGIEVVLYRDTIQLASCVDWSFTHVQCCRSGSVYNLVSPSTHGFQLETTLNNVAAPCNESPVYQELNSPFVCINGSFCMANATYDTDGDSVVYSMVQPLDGSGVPIPYNTGYSLSSPYASSNGHAFDPVSGNHCASPSIAGSVALAYKIEEYRNGILIGTAVRDIMLNMLNCNNPVFNFSGTITDTLGAPVTSGTVDVFEYGLNALGSSLAGTSAISGLGSYAVGPLGQGQYILRATADTNLYPGSFPTYHVQSFYWSYSDVVSSVCDSTFLIDIELVSGSDLVGAGAITGYLGDLGIIRTELGAPWPGIVIILERWPEREPVAHQFTSPTGHFGFQGVPDGNYRVLVDFPGLSMISYYLITIGPGSYTWSSIDYAADPQGIYASVISTGIESPVDRPVLVVPNPMLENAVVQLGGVPDGMAGSMIYDVTGKLVGQRSVNIIQGRFELERGQLGSGTYLVAIPDLGIRFRMHME